MCDTSGKMLSTVLLYKEILRRITRAVMRRNPHYLLRWIFLEYLSGKLERLPQRNLRWITLPDTALKQMLKIPRDDTRSPYIDCDSCALANIRHLEESFSPWFYACSSVTMRRYKLAIVPLRNVNENTVLISESMRHNLQNALRSEHLDKTCFILPSGDKAVEFASEARISLIVNPYDCPVQLVDTLLGNYFLHPRYLRVNDVFGIDPRQHALDRFYTTARPTFPVIHFRVKSLKSRQNGRDESIDGCYVVRGESTLIQEAQVHDYIPRRYIRLLPEEESALRQDERIRGLLNDRYPSVMMQSFRNLQSCIVPFTRKDTRLPIKPIFLVKGPRGCGKSRLIRAVSETMGMNLLAVDLAEVQALTSAQTEAKLHIVLQNARRCVPCILYLNNIQIFGKTAEGQKDERIISAFSAKIVTLHDERQAFSLIVVAASDETELPAELQRLFIETIHVEQLNQDKKAELISWLLASRNLTSTADLSKVSGLCSDFRLADLSALIMHAAKLRCKGTTTTARPEYSFALTQEDFDRAYEYMQSIYSDSKGAPRVPTVHWEDIGGLAELKREIIRRIQLPLLNAFGFGQSGLLLYGPPGTGKTLLAKAVATEYQLHFLSIKGPEVLNMYVGESEKNVREVFERARAAAPCIIFFDELDSLAPNRGRSGDSGGVMDRVVSQLLAEMDGLEESSSIFIIGATNRPDLIDPALLRPGRFDKMLYVGIHSDRASKLSVLQALTRKFRLREDGRELERVVDRLPDNVTGADLYSVCSNAWLNAVREFLTSREETESSTVERKPNSTENSVSVELHHFLDAVRELIPSVNDEEMERYSRIQTEISSF